MRQRNVGIDMLFLGIADAKQRRATPPFEGLAKLAVYLKHHMIFQI